MKWIKSFLNEPGTEEGSAQRLMLFMLVTVVLVLIVGLTIKNNKLPEIPTSLETLVEYIGTALVSGIAFGKGMTALRAIKAPGQEPQQ